MAITTMDGLVAALASGQYIDTEEASVAGVAGQYTSLWTAGGRPGAGAVPATGVGQANTNSTAGAIPYVNPGGSLTGYLARLEASSSAAESLIVYDRLVSASGLSGTVTTAQTVNSTALTRYTSGVNVGAWLEWYTATGSTACTATISYTNQAGTSGRSTTVAIAASTPAGRMIPIPLASGDTGVQSVQSVTLSVSTGTAGNFGITLAARICTVPLILANAGVIFDYAALGLPVIANNACIAFKVLCTTTVTGYVLTGMTFVSG
jgi:hypothetical protein